MDCHCFLQGLFLTQGLNLGLLHQQMDSLPLSRLGFLNLLLCAPLLNGIVPCWSCVRSCVHTPLLEEVFGLSQQTSKQKQICEQGEMTHFVVCWRETYSSHRHEGGSEGRFSVGRGRFLALLGSAFFSPKYTTESGPKPHCPCIRASFIFPRGLTA